MPKDNTLGAPTEGLGQTVTFAANAQGGGSQAQGGYRQTLRTGQTGGTTSTGRAQQIEVQPDPLMKTLFRLGNDILKPHVEAERTAAYVKGMQRAAQGEAVNEIVNEQPWYSQLFGPTSLIDGARAYSAAAAANSLSVDLEAKMPELRKMSGDEFASYSAKLLTSKNTGDSVTDAMIMQQASQALPQVMKSQAKNHLVWQNEQLVQTNADYFSTLAAKLGQVDAKVRTGGGIAMGPLPSGTALDDGDYLQAQTELTTAVATVPVGMDKRVHEKIVGATIVQALSAGNFSVYNTLESSGQLDKLSPDMLATIRAARNDASRTVKAELPQVMIDKLADWRTAEREANATPESTWEKANLINAEYTQMTGDRSKLISNGEVAMTLAQLEVYQEQQAAHARTLADKAATAAAKQKAQIDYLQGRSEQAVQGWSLSTDKKDDREAIFTNLKATQPADKYYATLARQNYYGVKHEAYEEYARGAVGMAHDTQNSTALHAAYSDIYLNLRKAGGADNGALARSYLGDQGAFMERYHKAFTNSAEQNPQARIDLAFAQAVVEPAKPATTKRVAEMKAVKADGWFMRKVYNTFPGDYVAIKDPEGLAELIAPRAPSDLPADEAMSHVLNNDKSVSLLGGHFWQKPVGATSIKDWLADPRNAAANGLGSDYKERAFDHAVEVVTREAGITNNWGESVNAVLGRANDKPKVSIYQVPTEEGKEPVLYIVGLDAAGNQKTGLLPASRVAKEWKIKNTSAPMRTSFGDAPIVADPDAPSIYAPAAEWELYRQRQKSKQK